MLSFVCLSLSKAKTCQPPHVLVSKSLFQIQSICINKISNFMQYKLLKKGKEKASALDQWRLQPPKALCMGSSQQREVVLILL